METRRGAPEARLQPLPPAFAATRASLHALAEHVVAPARFRATSRIGLRATAGGFGTPPFGEGRQIRVEEGEIVAGEGPAARRAPITTLAAAAEFVGIGRPGAPVEVYRPTTDVAPDAVLEVDRAAAHALAEWIRFAAAALEQLRSESEDASLLQMWPEHFDLAVDLGEEASGGRANFGGSPGDAGHPEPYLYVGPWVPQAGEFWNEPFGATLSYQALLAADDQGGAAVAFLRRGRDLLAG